jgi:hypothetical protein
VTEKKNEESQDMRSASKGVQRLCSGYKYTNPRCEDILVAYSSQFSNFRPYLTEKIFRLHYKNQSVNASQEKNCSLFLKTILAHRRINCVEKVPKMLMLYMAIYSNHGPLHY